MSDAEESTAKGMKIALVALPLCLLISIVGAVWFHWYKETEEVADPGLAMAGTSIDRAEVEDSLEKLSWLGARDWGTDEGKKAMRGALAFVEGTLSPQNYGFVVHKGAEVIFEGELWPMVWVDVEGGAKKEEVVMVCARYDGDDGSLVALMTAARVLRDAEMERTVRLLVFPESKFERMGDRRGEFVKKGEEVVATLELSLLGMPGGGNIGTMGADLGSMEKNLEREGLDRWLVTDGHETAVKVFGPEVARGYQRCFPALALDLGEAVPGEGDIPSLMARTQSVVEMVLALARGD